METPAPAIRVDNPRDRTPDNGWFRFHIGGIEATVVSDGRVRPHSIAGFFPDIAPDVLEASKARTGVNADHFSMEQNCLILRFDGHVVLFDTGVGTDRVSGWEVSGILLHSMACAGIQPDDVTDIFLTHAHSDHAWGLVGDDGSKLFPNARIFLSRVDFDYWTDTANIAIGGFTETCVLGARRNLLPYLDRIGFVQDGHEVLPGLVATASPGHSPGHMSYVIGSGADRLLFLGDVCHTSPLQLAHPDWSFAYDFDSGLAIKSRVALLDRAAAEGLTLLGYHFDFPGLGKVLRDGDAYRFAAKTAG